MAEDKRPQSTEYDAETSRRKFIKAAGKLAAYTPPAMMMLMQPTREALAQSSGGTLPPPD